jgi:hypothetical protein
MTSRFSFSVERVKLDCIFSSSTLARKADEQKNDWGQQGVSYIVFARDRFSTLSKRLESQK